MILRAFSVSKASDVQGRRQHFLKILFAEQRDKRRVDEQGARRFENNRLRLRPILHKGARHFLLSTTMLISRRDSERELIFHCARKRLRVGTQV